LTDIIAHRGSPALARENTVAAFIAARDLGADGVEFDVRRTSDGELVVHHDREIPGLGPIDQLTSAELPGWLPSLGQALDACRPLEVNVEIKNDSGSSAAEAAELLGPDVARLLRARSEAPRIVVSSFSLAEIDAVAALAPSLATAFLVEPGDDPFDALVTATEHGHCGLHPFHLAVDGAIMRAARAAGVAIRTWTVDDSARIAALAGMGVDAVITNDVGAARRALGRSEGPAAQLDQGAT